MSDLEMLAVRRAEEQMETIKPRDFALTVIGDRWHIRRAYCLGCGKKLSNDKITTTGYHAGCGPRTLQRDRRCWECGRPARGLGYCRDHLEIVRRYGVSSILHITATEERLPSCVPSRRWR